MKMGIELGHQRRQLFRTPQLSEAATFSVVAAALCCRVALKFLYVQLRIFTNHGFPPSAVVLLLRTMADKPRE